MPPATRRVPGTGETRPTVKARQIKVRATRMGYYDHIRRREGDVFIVDEQAFSSTWMEKVAPSTPESVTTAQEAVTRENEELRASRRAAATAAADAEVL